MIGLDTNVLVRYFVQDDVAQASTARRIIEEQLLTEGPGYVSLVVIAELVWVIGKAYSRSRADLVRLLETMLGADNLLIQNEREVYRAMEALKTGEGSFADALIAELGRWAGCKTTLTFDRKAARISGFTPV